VDAKHLPQYRPLGPAAIKPSYEEAARLLGLDAATSDASRADQIAAHGERLLDLTGARIAAQREGSPALWELGYAFAVPVLRRTGSGLAGDAAPYQDILYGSCDVGLGLVSLRALLSWEVRNARCGGANANVLMQF